MQFDRSIASRFSRAAKTYTQSAMVQRDVVEKLCGFLSDSSSPIRILEIGCGTGGLTEKLLQKFPFAKIDAVDIAGGMIEHCRSKFSENSRLNFFVCDVMLFDSAEKYDLIVSASALHWIDDLNALFSKLKNLLVESGGLIFSLMLDETFSELQTAKRAVLSSDKIGSVLPSFSTVFDAVGNAGFLIKKAMPFSSQTIYKSTQQFLREISAQGVTAGSVSRSQTVLTRGELRQVAEKYDELFSVESGVVATFACAIFVCCN